jgi:hypothetical protein
MKNWRSRGTSKQMGHSASDCSNANEEIDAMA